jgi:hypothetical protein
LLFSGINSSNGNLFVTLSSFIYFTYFLLAFGRLGGTFHFYDYLTLFFFDLLFGVFTF